MSSRLPTDEALAKEDRIDEIKKKHSSPIPHLLQAQQAPTLPYAKVVGLLCTESYPAPSPDPTTWWFWCLWQPNTLTQEFAQKTSDFEAIKKNEI